MKLLKFWSFGRPVRNNDLKALQDQIATIEEQFSGVGAFTLKGCTHSAAGGGKYNVSAGLVYLDGKIMRFDGATNVTLPIDIYAAAPVESDSRNDKNGNQHNAMIEYKATWRPASNTNPQIPGNGNPQD